MEATNHTSYKTSSSCHIDRACHAVQESASSYCQEKISKQSQYNQSTRKCRETTSNKSNLDQIKIESHKTSSGESRVCIFLLTGMLHVCWFLISDCYESPLNSKRTEMRSSKMNSHWEQSSLYFDTSDAEYWDQVNSTKIKQFQRKFLFFRKTTTSVNTTMKKI